VAFEARDTEARVISYLFKLDRLKEIRPGLDLLLFRAGNRSNVDSGDETGEPYITFLRVYG
jgi:hypothetical protein